MTELGFSLSQVIQEATMNAQVSSEDDSDGGVDHDDHEEYLDLAMQMNSKKKTRRGVRGRPKAVDLGFGRSTTHKLPPEAARLMGTANQAFVSRQYDSAKDHLLQVIRIAPNSPEPYYTMGLVHEEEGDREKASGFYLLSAMLNPSSHELWCKLADWNEEDPRPGKREEAVFCLSKAISAVEDADLKVDLIWRRARLYLAMGEPAAAVKSFSKLIAQNPDDIQLVRRVAKLAIAQNVAGTAADVLERAAGRGDKVSWSFVNLLLELLFTEQPIDADRIASICKQYAVQLADQSMLLSNPQSSQWSEDEKQAWSLRHMPMDIYLKYAIACPVVDIERQVVFSADPLVFSDLLTMLVDRLFDSKEYSFCAELIEFLIEHDSLWSVRLSCILGHCYVNMNQQTRAIESFKACLAQDPQMEEARVALATCYKKVGDEAGLLETLESGRRLKMAERAKTKRRVQLSEDEDIWEEEESDDSGSDSSSESGDSSSDSDSGRLLVATIKKRQQQRSRGKHPKRTRTTKRVDYSEEECLRVKQEYARILLAMEVGMGRRELFSEALLSALSLIQSGLFQNPNVMVTSNKQCKWLLGIDWQVERRALKGLLVTEWSDLLVKYCAHVSEHFGNQEQAAKLLFRLCTESMFFKICGDDWFVRLSVLMAECAVRAREHVIVLTAIRPMIRRFAGNDVFLHWLRTSIITPGQMGRQCLLTSTPFIRFIHRLVPMITTSKERNNLLALQGHLYAMAGSWEEAIRTYLQITADSCGSDQHTTTSSMAASKYTFLANAYYHRAQQRTCTCQKWYLMMGWACLGMADTGAQTDSVNAYNKARYLQGLGLDARKFYAKSNLRAAIFNSNLYK